MTPLDVARRIGLARARAGLSCQDLAARMGLAGSTIRDWEAGRREPSLASVLAAAGALGLPPAWFFDPPGPPSLAAVHAQLLTAALTLERARQAGAR